MVGQENEKMDYYVTPSAYYKLFQDEKMVIHPGHILMMGSL
jgi:hypothetical protein